MKPVRPDPDADEEIRKEIRWHEDRVPGLGQQLWDELQRVVDLIQEHPAIGALVPGIRAVQPPPRRLRLRRFHFYVIYRESPDEIELVALAHMSRKPGYWRSRTA